MHQSDEFELVAVAVDVGGENAVRTWTERAAAQFPTVVDAGNQLGALLGYKAIPNGVLLDPQGVICFAKFGGFDVNRPDDLQAVDAAMQAHRSSEAPAATPVRALSEEDQARVAALLRAGADKFRAGEGAAALAAWRTALAIDPDNLIIRKQLWRADHPERFGEVIDFHWQKGQLAMEREREAVRRG